MPTPKLNASKDFGCRLVRVPVHFGKKMIRRGKLKTGAVDIPAKRINIVVWKG